MLDYIIVGQGISGSLLGYLLHQKNCRILILDDGRSATKVAAGLISPVSGKRLTQTWGYEKMMPVAKTIYSDIQNKLGVSFFNPIPEYRFFQTETEFFKKRSQDPKFMPYFGSPLNVLEQDNRFKKNEGVVINGSYQFDTAVFLDHITRFFLRHSLLQKTQVQYEDFMIGNPISYKGIPTKTIIFCEGFSIKNNPFLPALDYRMAKGEVLTFQSNQLPRNVVINQGKWIIPTQDTGFKCGATYEWTSLKNFPTAVAYNEISHFLDHWVTEYQPIKIESGVRSIVRDNRPIIGAVSKGMYVMNGMGSKGLMLAPYYAMQLVHHMLYQKSIDKESDISRPGILK